MGDDPELRSLLDGIREDSQRLRLQVGERSARAPAAARGIGGGGGGAGNAASTARSSADGRAVARTKSIAEIEKAVAASIAS